MPDRILICTDLDRTLLPNGSQAESPGARRRFAALAARPETTLVYVTGRYRALVEKAIASYNLPLPDFLIGDVGTTIYELSKRGWRYWPDWDEEIARDWRTMGHSALKTLFLDLAELRLQESAKQNRFKLSYYVPLYVDREKLLQTMQERLGSEAVRADLIWSVDEPAGIGLLDVVPASATKFHAVEFLMRRLGFTTENTVFCGDSGNDLPVLTSPIHSVLVANATAEVCREARQSAQQQGTSEALYIARGDFMGMNGNYSAGILEGIAHFLPHTRAWWADAETEESGK